MRFSFSAGSTRGETPALTVTETVCQMAKAMTTKVATQATADVQAATAATFTLTARYANGQGGDGQYVTRTLSVSVDGGTPQKLTLPVTGGWDTWALASVPVTLGAGHHSVRLVRTAAATSFAGNCRPSRPWRR